MKERFLTVMVPITDDDAIPVVSLPPVSPLNINVIYKHEGVYKRVCYNGMYEYQEVVEREFPYLGKPLEIFDFTYDAVRMGTAPTISADNVMYEADKDEFGNAITLDKLWKQECHVYFNGETFYLQRIPTSHKDASDTRYKYTIDFVSERVVLEHVYFYDVVRPYQSSRLISESSVFSFYGDIYEFVKRINASLLESGLAQIELRPGVTRNSFLTLEEFNDVGLGRYTGSKNTSDPYGIVYGPDSQIVHYPHNDVFEHFHGEYSLYLLNCVYVVSNPQKEHIGPADGGFDEIYDGDLSIIGYKCVVGKDKYGEDISTDEKLIMFDNKKIHEAMQEVHDSFGLQYYIYKEKDINGDFTGNTIIMIADCQHDFADRNLEDTDFVRDEYGVPTTGSPLDYGITNALITKEKANSTEQIITRITGIGSSDNIPYYYPNPTADGWIKAVYERASGSSGVVSYPEDEGSTPAQHTLYEKYLKNKLGKEFIYKKLIGSYYMPSDIPELTWYENTKMLNVKFTIKCDEVFHIEQFGVKNVYNNNRVTFTCNDSNDSLVAGGDMDIINVYEYPIGTYKLNLHFSFDDHPAPPEFGWYLIIIKTGVVEEDYFWHCSLFVDASKFTKDEVLSFEREAVRDLKNNWYYTDRYGIRRLAWGLFVDDWDEFENKGVISPRRRWDFKTDKPCKIFDDLSSVDGGWDGKYYIIELDDGEIDSKTEVVYNENELYKLFIQGYLKICTKHWQLDKKDVNPADYGLTVTGTVAYADKIKFQRLKKITPQSTLMPELYVKTDGERRFYDAINYPLDSGTPDAKSGEILDGGHIKNPIYYHKNTTTHYEFENEKVNGIQREHIGEFDDIKPSIKGIENYMLLKSQPADWATTYRSYYIKVNGTFVQNTNEDTWVYNHFYKKARIDVVEEFAFDEVDDNEIWESSEGNNISGEYKHPFFFAKLRPLGFNIFDLALQEDMIISMTTGLCGACSFKIGVDEKTKKNPVQVWLYDVYSGPTYQNKGDKIYSAGDLRRYVDTTFLCYDTNGTPEGYISIKGKYEDDTRHSDLNPVLLNTNQRISEGEFERRFYPAELVYNEEVGSLKQDNKSHFEGDVITSGPFIDSQQDTTEEYVWVALYKDVETFGQLMPYSKPDYGDGIYSHYMDPKGSVYHNRKTGEDFNLSDTDADKFVILNIKLPQVYLRNAERELSRAMVEYMYDNNAQKFNFTIEFSRIFVEENPDVDQQLNENSVLYIKYDDKTFRQYVKHYTYKIKAGEALPEIKVDLNEELALYKNEKEKLERRQQQSLNGVIKKAKRMVQASQQRVLRNSIGRNEDVVISGNIVSANSVASFDEVSVSGRVLRNGLVGANLSINENKKGISKTNQNLRTNYFKKVDFEITNGTDLRIGDSLVLPTYYMKGPRLMRRQWDSNAREFIEVSKYDFAPSFIDTGNDSIVEFGYISVPGDHAPTFMADKYYYKDGDFFFLLKEQPEDWAINWNTYYQESSTKKSIVPAQRSVFNSFVNSVNTFNSAVGTRISQIKKTVEVRMMRDVDGAEQDEFCVDRIVWRDLRGNNYFWLDSEGDQQPVPAECTITNGMTEVEWVPFVVS